MNNKKRRKPHHVRVVSRIDNKSPHFNASVYLKAHDLKQDVVRVKQIDRENIKLLKKINIIHRLGVSIVISYFKLNIILHILYTYINKKKLMMHIFYLYFLILYQIVQFHLVLGNINLNEINTNKI